MSSLNSTAKLIASMRHQMRVLGDHYAPSQNEKKQRKGVLGPIGTINRYLVAEQHLRGLQAKREHATWIYAKEGLPTGYPFTYVRYR